MSEKPDHRWELKELAHKMQWSRSRISHHASRMQTRRLIDKETDPNGARGCILHLTDEGSAVLRKAASHHLNSVRSRFIDHLTREEMAMLRNLSNRIADLPE